MKTIAHILALAASTSALHMAAGAAFGQNADNDLPRRRHVTDIRPALPAADAAPVSVDVLTPADRLPSWAYADRPAKWDSDSDGATDSDDGADSDRAGSATADTERPPVPVICFASPEYFAHVNCSAESGSATFVLAGLWPDTCVPDRLSIRVEDGRIVLATRYHEDPAAGCGDMPTYWYLSITTGPLPNGEYKVFTTINAVNHRGAAIQRPTLSVQCAANDCYANCDGSRDVPSLNVADFGCFLQRFGAGDPWANCDGSQVEPVLNIADFTCFLQKFAAGCP